jgi:hypothetical protein
MEPARCRATKQVKEEGRQQGFSGAPSLTSGGAARVFSPGSEKLIFTGMA